MKKIEKEYFKLVKYQWESLRTNPEYIKDYKKYHNLIVKDSIEYNRFLPRMEGFFIKKYGITPHDPSVPFPDKIPPPKPPHNCEKGRGRQKFLQWMLYFYFGKMASPVYPLPYNWDKKVVKALLSKDKSVDNNFMNNYQPMTKEETENQLSITLMIKLDAPIKIIMNEVEKEVKEWQQKRRAVIKKKPIRHRIIEYTNYYRVYTLVKNGQKWEAIARELYPMDFERDKNYAIRKVKRDFERWKNVGMTFKGNLFYSHRIHFKFGIPLLFSGENYYKGFQEYCKQFISPIKAHQRRLSPPPLIIPKNEFPW